MHLRKLSLLALVLNSLIGCGGTTIVKPIPLPLPDKPIYPSIKESELQCLTQETYDALIIGKTLRESYAEKMRRIILSTH